MADDRNEHNEPSFEELFEASMKQASPARPEVGDEMEGTILQIGPDWTFVDVGAKGEARIATSELTDDKGRAKVSVGDRIEARVLRIDGDGVLLSRVIQGGLGGRRVLEEARELELPVEGVVQAVIKGGLEVTVAGVRAFCPASHADLRYVEDLAEFVGKRLTFRVMEIRDNGRTVVLSRKALLEEEQEKLAAETRQRLAVGARFLGKVTSVRDFGAFVDIGGIEGLVHVSEISHARVDRPQEVLSPGQSVEVEVIRMEGDRLSFSMRNLEADPWDQAQERFSEGTRHQGLVTRVQPYGAFVELAPGIEGLLHVSTLDDPRITDASKVFTPGQEIQVEVVGLDLDRKRVSLAPADDRPQASENRGSVPSSADTDFEGELVPGLVVTGKVDRVEPYGVFVRLPGPRRTGGRRPRGLVPREEIPGGREAGDLHRRFKVGDPIRVQIIEPDEKGRMRLSLRSLEDLEEQRELQRYREGSGQAGDGPKKSGTSGFGTLGDLLKDKL